MSPDEAGGATPPSGGEATGGVQDAGPGDQSFAFPEDFEQVGDAGAEGASAEPQQTSQEAAPAQPPGRAPPTAQPSVQAPAGAQGPQPTPPGQPTRSAPQAEQPQQPARQQGVEREARVQAPPSPTQLIERLNANRSALVNDLASNRFKVELTNEEKTALEQDAIAALPTILSRLGANLYYETVVTSLNQIANFVPRLAQQVAEQSAGAASAEGAFYQRWTGFDRANPEHARVVNHFANSFRQMNPNASLSEAIDSVGRMATAYLGLQHTSGAAANGRSAPRSSAPRPFAPAGGGRVTTPIPNQGAEGSPWSGMGMDFDE